MLHALLKIDIAWFQNILVDCGIRIPRDLLPDLPGALWFFQMGVISFWVIDELPRQSRSEKLLELASKNVAMNALGRYRSIANGLASLLPGQPFRRAANRRIVRRNRKIGENLLIGLNAEGIFLAVTVDHYRGHKIDLRAVAQRKGKRGRRDSVSGLAEKTGIGTSAKGNGNPLAGTPRVAIDQHRNRRHAAQTHGAASGFRIVRTIGLPFARHSVFIKPLAREASMKKSARLTVSQNRTHGQAVSDRNTIALLPANAGGGCSTVALNVAAALADRHAKKVLLIESDRRSGILSIMLDLKNRSGLSEALQQAGEMTPVEWQQHTVWVSGIHLLPANPARRGPLPTWAAYYQLLRFTRKPYEYVFVDLPEVVNEATAEVVKSARDICIVCTPEVPSLKLAAQRSAELEACQVPSDRIHLVVNRWERGGLSIEEVEEILERPVFATLPNDYKQVKTAILESRLVSPESRFAKGCKALAQKLSGLPEAAPAESKFTFLRELVRIAD